MSSNNIDFTITGKFEDELTAATKQAQSSLESLKQATEDLTKSTNQVGPAATKGGKGIDKIKTSTAAAATKMRTFATALPGVINGLGNVASGAIMLYRNYRDMNDTQLQVMRQTRMLSLAQEAEAKAQEKVNTFVDAGDTSSAEYKQALLDLDQAKQKVAISTEALSEAEERHSDAITDVYLSVIPSAIGVIGTLASAILTYQANALTAATATNGLSTAAKAVRVAMMAIPLVAIAAALLAVKTNAGGFRDMLNELGSKIGTLIPEIKPLLQWIKDFAEALGLTEKKMDLTKAWDLLVSGFTGAFEKIKNTDWKAVINTIVTGISDFINNFDWDTAWQSFKDALADTAKWLGPIMDDIAEFISKTIASEGPKWWAGFQEALGATAAWVGTGIRKIGAAIISTITSAATKWWVGFQNQLGKDVSWVGAQLAKIGKAITSWATWEQVGKDIWTNISKGLSSAVSSIGAGAGGFLESIKNALFGPGGLQSVFAAEGGEGGMFFAPFIDLNLYNQKLAELKTSTQQTTFAVSQMFTSMTTSIQNTLTTMSASFANAFTPLQISATQQIGQTITVFTNFRNSVQQILGVITTLFAPAFANLAPIVTQAVGKAIPEFTKMQTSIQQTLSKITTLFAPAFANLGPIVQKATSQASANFVTMSTSIKGSLSQASSAVNSFASAASSSFNKVGSAASTATSKVKALAASINSLKSKTITITVKYNVQSRPSGLEHGGSFVNMAQHGFSGVVNSSTKYGGVRMGEGNKPELVTVTPLTRGTGNTQGLSRAQGGGFGAAGGKDLVNNITVVLDGRVIQRFVEKTALHGYNLQV